MRPITVAVVRAGLVSEGALAELRRWGLPVDVMPIDEADIVTDLPKIVEIIQAALESHDQVRMQDTDLDIVKRFLSPEWQREGKLNVVADGTSGSFKTLFCFTVMGEVALPWRSEAVYDLMTNGETTFTWVDNEGKTRKEFFVDTRELFIGDRKAFMICTTREAAV